MNTNTAPATRKSKPITPTPTVTPIAPADIAAVIDAVLSRRPDQPPAIIIINCGINSGMVCGINNGNTISGADAQSDTTTDLRRAQIAGERATQITGKDTAATVTAQNGNESQAITGDSNELNTPPEYYQKKIAAALDKSI